MSVSRESCWLHLPVVEGTGNPSENGEAVDDDDGEGDEEEPGPLEAEGEEAKEEHLGSSERHSNSDMLPSA